MVPGSPRLMLCGGRSVGIPKLGSGSPQGGVVIIRRLCVKTRRALVLTVPVMYRLADYGPRRCCLRKSLHGRSGTLWPRALELWSLQDKAKVAAGDIANWAVCSRLVVVPLLELCWFRTLRGGVVIKSRTGGCCPHH